MGIEAIRPISVTEVINQYSRAFARGTESEGGLKATGVRPNKPTAIVSVSTKQPHNVDVLEKFLGTRVNVTR